ncbi:hypothetical protein [Streptomyces regalis]|uniref:hypothetical protein n=1 Tax=Streptomyces regalis TaxID=68262 RepID=UPI00131C59A8|nr:hypothetical protein [Streptomyces regalis]
MAVYFLAEFDALVDPTVDGDLMVGLDADVSASLPVQQTESAILSVRGARAGRRTVA